MHASYCPAAVRGLTLAEASTLKPVMAFIAHYVNQSGPFPEMQAAVIACGDSIVRSVLEALAEHTPRSQVDNYADILLALNKHYGRYLAQWLQVLKQPDYPTRIISQEDKDRFAKAILK